MNVRPSREPGEPLPPRKRGRLPGYRESSVRPALIFPLIVASALFMENVDQSALATALPTIAAHFGQTPVSMRVVLTAYLLALAVTLPISGWLADRFGARTIFRLAIVLFIAGSMGCSFSGTIPELVAGRLLQGCGGALMVPVGRLVVLRSVPKAEMVSAFAWIAIPGLIGPIVGPVMGGFVTTYLDWHWVFWINVPFAVVSFCLASLYVPEKEDGGETRSFDFAGFATLGTGLALLVAGSTAVGAPVLDDRIAVALLLGGVAMLAIYAFTSRRRQHAVIDLGLFRIRTFALAAIGNTLFRLGIGAVPLLLPSLLQLGLGKTAFEAGGITFAMAVGALLMKFVAPRLIQRFGYRRVLVVSALLAGLAGASPALFRDWTPVWFMLGCLLISGFIRSVHFTAMITISYCDVDPGRMSRATSAMAVIQHLGAGFGITGGALMLHFTTAGQGLSDPASFAPAFLGVGMLIVCCAIPYLFLDKDAGSSFSGHSLSK